MDVIGNETLDDQAFESEVRRICHYLWPSTTDPTAEMLGERERDGVFRTDSETAFVEATTSLQKDKAKKDITKLHELVAREQKKDSSKAVHGWFVTKEDPTAHQVEVQKKYQSTVKILSFAQLQSRVINSAKYLEFRRNYRFGSVRDPRDDNYDVSSEYVPIDLLEHANQNSLTIKQMARDVSEGHRFILLGDYGTGKSMTLRELFKRLAALYYKDRTRKFPLAINLRDHQGQEDPDEALHRHAKKIGFGYPGDLVRAWRLGYCAILLDGFDELSTARWTGNLDQFRQARHRAATLIRKFVDETPRDVPIVIAGRGNYYSTISELRSAIGVTSQFRQLTMTEFTGAQIRQFLDKQGWAEAIPDWFPSRPLLLGYLASRGLLEGALHLHDVRDRAFGWIALLEKICEREAKSELGIDQEQVLGLLARAASYARASADGAGPLVPAQLVSIFSEVCGYEPDESGLTAIQRLPGLGVDEAELNSRRFVDQDLLAAAQSIDVVSYIQNPYQEIQPAPENWSHTLSSFGIDVLAARLENVGVTGKQLAASVDAIKQKYFDADSLISDCVRAGMSTDSPPNGADVAIKEVVVDTLVIATDAADWSNVTFSDSLIDRIDVDGPIKLKLAPRLLNCVIGNVSGIQQNSVGDWLGACEVGSVESASVTTDNLLQMQVPMGVSVVLSILKKIYMQPGRGRLESAMFRGLDDFAKSLVPKALELVRKHDYAYAGKVSGRTAWFPLKDKRAQAIRLLQDPRGNLGNELLSEAANF